MTKTYKLLGDGDETEPLISKDRTKDPISKIANSPPSSSSTRGSCDLCADPQRGCVSGRPQGLDASANLTTIPCSLSHVSGSGYEPSASSTGSDTDTDTDSSSSESETPTRRSLQRLATYHVDGPTWRKVWQYLECSRTHEAGRDDNAEDQDQGDNEGCLTQCVPAWLSSVLWPAAASMSKAPPNHSQSHSENDAQPTWHQHMRHPQPPQPQTAAASSTAPDSSSSRDSGPRYFIKFPSGRRVERYQDATTRRIVVMELGPDH